VYIVFLCISAVRNFGMGDTKIQVEAKSIKRQKSEFTMRVSKHEAVVRFSVFLLLFHCWQWILPSDVHPFGTGCHTTSHCPHYGYSNI